MSSTFVENTIRLIVICTYYMGFLSCIRYSYLKIPGNVTFFVTIQTFFGLEYQNESVDNTIIFPIGNMVLQTTTKVFIIFNMAKNLCNRFLSFHTKYMAIPPIDMFFILLINTSSAKITKKFSCHLMLISEVGNTIRYSQITSFYVSSSVK